MANFLLFLVFAVAVVSNGQDIPGYRTVCYLEGWSHWLSEPNRFEVPDIDASLCTHVVWDRAELNASLNIVVHDNGDEQIYQTLAAFKGDHPQLKTMLAIGDWNMDSDAFLRLVATDASRTAFAAEASGYLRRFKFDGIVLDWAGFVGQAMNREPAAKHQFTQLFQTLMAAFSAESQASGSPRLLLAAEISPWTNDWNNNLELPQLASSVDWLDVKAYDLHGSWESGTGHHSQLYPAYDGDTDSISHRLQVLVSKNVPKSKIDLGIPFFGRAQNLTDPTYTDIGAPTQGGAGTLTYHDICQLLASQNATLGHVANTNAPYIADNAGRWTSFDDVASVREKVDYVMENGFGGVAVYNIDNDDFNGLCGEQKSPLLHAIASQMGGLIG